MLRSSVSLASIPDYLALVGDAADGYSGLPGSGTKSSAAVLSKFVHLDSIPADWREWGVNAANASGLAHTLSNERDRALLFRTLATLRIDIALFEDVDELQWHGPKPGLEKFGGATRRGGHGGQAATRAVGLRNAPILGRIGSWPPHHWRVVIRKAQRISPAAIRIDSLLSVRVIAAEVCQHLSTVPPPSGMHPPRRQRNCPQDTQNPAHRYSLLLRDLGLLRGYVNCLSAQAVRMQSSWTG